MKRRGFIASIGAALLPLANIVRPLTGKIVQVADYTAVQLSDGRVFAVHVFGPGRSPAETVHKCIQYVKQGLL